MKLRQGFVSNSSSSSFVVLIKQEAFENALDEFDINDQERLVLNYLFKDGEVFKEPAKTHFKMSSFWEYWYQIPPKEIKDAEEEFEYHANAFELFDEFCKYVSENYSDDIYMDKEYD